MERLSEITGLSVPMVERIVLTAPHRYKVYSIPKRSGRGARIIAQPAREVKSLQRLAVTELQQKLPVHDAAYAYVKGRGIRTNARQHVDSKFILKLDFANFFPSVVPNDLRAHLAKFAPESWSEREVSQLMRLFFWSPRVEDYPRLSIGAPSSPFLSNTVMYCLDVDLERCAQRAGARYTRYADDLTFSSQTAHSMDGLLRDVQSACEATPYPRVRLNIEKTVFASKRGRRSVTGIVLTSTDDISLGRERKRLIRSMAFRRSQGELNEVELAKLRGLLSFARDIEPEFVRRLEQGMARKAMRADLGE